VVSGGFAFIVLSGSSDQNQTVVIREYPFGRPFLQKSPYTLQETTGSPVACRNYHKTVLLFTNWILNLVKMVSAVHSS
jgi:hypothetical protein